MDSIRTTTTVFLRDKEFDLDIHAYGISIGQGLSIAFNPEITIHASPEQLLKIADEIYKQHGHKQEVIVDERTPVSQH